MRFRNTNLVVAVVASLLLLFSLPTTVVCQATESSASSRWTNNPSNQQKQSYPNPKQEQNKEQEQEQTFGYQQDDDEGKEDTKNSHEDERRPPSHWNDFLQDEATAKAVQQFFQRPKPRGLLHAVWKASKTTTLGFLLGMTSVFSFPATSLFLGNYHFKSILASTLFGLVVGVASLGYGIWNGLRQCVWGIWQTPKSIESWWNTDLVWNPHDGLWQVYDLPKHAQELLASTVVHDASYYQLLEVATTATKPQIKRAYHKKAKTWHPDKNPDNVSSAAEHFLRLHAAYETLSDDSQRSHYDEWGAQGGGDGQTSQRPLPLDPQLFFTALFDSYGLEPYMGELAITTWATQLLHLCLFANTRNKEHGQKQTVQKMIHLIAESKPKAEKRQVDIALHLRTTVDPYALGYMKEDAYREWSRLEACRVLEDGAKLKLLESLGKALKKTASQHRGFHHLAPFGWPVGALVWTSKAAAHTANKLKIYKDVVQLLKYATERAIHANKCHGESRNQNDDDKEQCLQEGIHDMLPSLIRLAWNVNEMDIGKTVDGACWKLFRDASVPKRERFRRARAVEILGEEFLRVSSEYEYEDEGELQNNNDSMDRVELQAQVESALYLAQNKVPKDDVKIRHKRLKRRVRV